MSFRTTELFWTFAQTIFLRSTETLTEVQKGNYSSWERNFRYRQSHEQTANEKLTKEIEKMKQDALRKQQWANKIESSKIGEHRGDRGYIGHMSARMAKEPRRPKAEDNVQ